MPEALTAYALRDGHADAIADPAELVGLIADGSTRLWIDLTDPSPKVVEEVGRRVGLHPLVAEDIIESNERSKVEFVDGIIHVVMYALTRPAQVERHEIDFALGRQFLLSVHPAAWDPTSAHQLKLGVAALLERGPDFLLWALVDGIVDGYFRSSTRWPTRSTRSGTTLSATPSRPPLSTSSDSRPSSFPCAM